MIKLRLFHVLAMAMIIAFGWSGLAAAQTPAPNGHYNFTFSDGNGVNAGGMLDVVNGVITSISGTSSDIASYATTSILNILPPGSLTSAYDSAPNDNKLFLLAPQLTGGGVAFSTGAGDQEIHFSNLVGGYVASDGNGDTSTVPGGIFQATVAAPAPIPGGGPLSWIIAALCGSALGLRRLTRKQVVSA